MTAANSKTFYERYCEIRFREDERQRTEDEINNWICDQHKKEILAALRAEGIPEERVEANGYSFRLDLNDMRIAFVVQTERVCGEMCRMPQNRKEGMLLANRDFILSREELKDEFCREFLYQDFCIDTGGDPAWAIEDIIAMAKNPLAPLNESAADDDKSQGGAR